MNEGYRQDRADDRADRIETAADVETDRVATAADVETERVATAAELAAVAVEKARAHRMIAFAQLAAYLMILVVSVGGWRLLAAQDVEQCEASQANREATRGVVAAIEQLGTRLVLGGEAGEITPEQQAALDQFAAFKAEQHALLAGPVC